MCNHTITQPASMLLDENLYFIQPFPSFPCAYKVKLTVAPMIQWCGLNFQGGRVALKFIKIDHIICQGHPNHLPSQHLGWHYLDKHAGWKASCNYPNTSRIKMTGSTTKKLQVFIALIDLYVYIALLALQFFNNLFQAQWEICNLGWSWGLSFVLWCLEESYKVVLFYIN